MTVGLTASGAYANLERLQKEGIVNDLIAMVDSVRALPYDPENVIPPLHDPASATPPLSPQ